MDGWAGVRSFSSSFSSPLLIYIPPPPLFLVFFFLCTNASFFGTQKLSEMFLSSYFPFLLTFLRFSFRRTWIYVRTLHVQVLDIQIIGYSNYGKNIQRCRNFFPGPQSIGAELRGTSTFQVKRSPKRNVKNIPCSDLCMLVVSALLGELMRQVVESENNVSILLGT